MGDKKERGGQLGTGIDSHFLGKGVERQQVDESSFEGFVFISVQALNRIILLDKSALTSSRY